VLVTQVLVSLRHCSNKYKLAREGEKEKDEDFEKVKEVFSSQVVLKEIIPDGGGKIIPPARNGERECSGE